MGLQTGKKVIGTKSRFIRRFISVLTVFALAAALLPVVPGAGITAEAAALSALYINEKIEGGINQSVDLSKDGSGSGWSYTAGTKTLTLNGFNGSYIEATGDLNMVLKGTNTITPAADAENAVKVDGTLTIDKSSSDDTDILKIKNTAMTGSGSYRYMLYGTTDVVINGGTVDIEVATSANSCLYGCCYVSLNGSSNLKIQVESGNTPYGAKQMKVYDAADVDVYVKGTNVYYFGGVAVTSLYARGSGQLKFVAESPEGKPVFAIESLWEAYLKEGGTITATGMVAQYHNNNQQLIGEKVTVSPAERIMDMKFYTGSYYNVYCDKEGTPYNSMTFTGTDTPQPLTYMDCSMWDIPAGKTGESMERIYLAKGLCGAKEGSAPRYEIIEGSLPDGITLYSWGDIDGTPTTECDAGTVKIRVTNTAKASEENTVEFEIAYGAISVPSPVTGVELDKHELILEAGASDTLNATVSPSNATVTTVDWSSDNSSIASVSGGTVKGNEAGKTTITVTTRQGGLKDTCTVYVKEKKPEVTTDGNYILGLVSGASYTVNGTAITADGGGRIAIEDAWRGTNVSIIKTNEEPKCTSDTATLDIPSVHTHVTTKVESNPSDCTKPGNKEYYICTICDAWYWDSAATQFIDNHANVVIAASHTLTHVEENGAKCDADGNKEYYTCSVCSKWYEDASATKEITDHNSVVIPASHSITLVTSQASTCKVNGNKAYYTCSKCGKWYKDLDATTEITDHDSVVLPLAGHKDTDSNGKCDVCEATVSTPQPTATPKVTATPQPTATPKVTATPQPTATPKVTATPQPTSEPQATARPVPGNPQTTNAPQATGGPQTPGEQATQAPAVGTKLNDSKSKAVYIITKSGLSGGTVEYYAPVSKTAKTAIIPATIKIGGITYKVTSIAKNAFKNNKKLKAITIKATGLKKIGKGAFRKISKKAVIRVPKSKLKAYTKMIKKTGIAKTVKIKK